MEYKISIHHDDCAANPFKDWDCEPPIICGSYDRHISNITVYDSYDSDLVCSSYLPNLTRGEIKENLHKVIEVLGKESLWRGLNDFHPITRKSYQGNAIYAINDALNYAYECLPMSEQLDLYSEFLTIKGIINLRSYSSGYSQGDYLEVLIIASPEYEKSLGITITKPEELESSLDLFSNWAWGNCYGYVIEKINRCDKCDAEHLEAEDSCYGFYGDIEENGMLENIPAQLHDQARKAFRNIIY